MRPTRSFVNQVFSENERTPSTVIRVYTRVPIVRYQLEPKEEGGREGASGGVLKSGPAPFDRRRLKSGELGTPAIGKLESTRQRDNPGALTALTAIILV